MFLSLVPPKGTGLRLGPSLEYCTGEVVEASEGGAKEDIFRALKDYHLKGITHNGTPASS